MGKMFEVCWGDVGMLFGAWCGDVGNLAMMAKALACADMRKLAG